MCSRKTIADLLNNDTIEITWGVCVCVFINGHVQLQSMASKQQMRLGDQNPATFYMCLMCMIPIQYAQSYQPIFMSVTIARVPPNLPANWKTQFTHKLHRFSQTSNGTNHKNSLPLAADKLQRSQENKFSFPIQLTYKGRSSKAVENF